MIRFRARDWLIYLVTVMLVAVVFGVTGLFETMLVGKWPLAYFAYVVIGLIAVWGDRRLRRLGGDKEDKGEESTMNETERKHMEILRENAWGDVKAMLENQTATEDEDGERVLISTGEYEIAGVDVMITTGDLFTAINDGKLTHYFVRETGEYDGYARDVSGEEEQAAQE